MPQAWTEVCHQIFGDWEVQNIVQFTEECVMYMKKHVLVKKLFTNGLTIGFPLGTWVKKTVHGVETNWLSSKEKVLDKAVNKEGYADSFSGAWNDSSLLISLKKVQL